MMKKKIVTLLVPLSLLALPALTLAATDTHTLDATATVSAKCVITSTSNIAFGTVDPTTNKNYDGAGEIKTRCSKGTPQFIFITTPTAGLKMTNTATTESITYGIYSDIARTITFPSVSKTTPVPPGHQGNEFTTFVYGRVVVDDTHNNTISAGAYTQTLTATIEW